MKIATKVRSSVPHSTRLKQLSAMFDAPLQKVTELSWEGDLPIEERAWNIGMIVGPSGCGKTTIARETFGISAPPIWDNKHAAIDNFGRGTLDEIVAACQSVGFNTVPAWMRPHGVLSNGEQFRAGIARLMLEAKAGPLVVDEFTSVVDRQVAKITSHAVQKWARREDRQFVAVTCHYDIEDWLQPDWVLEPATMTFRWRSVQPRPRLNVEISPAPFAAWKLFAPFHYLTADVHRAAKMFVAYVEGEPAAIAAVMQQPGHDGMKQLSRVVTLPDYQGIGLIFHLSDTLGAALRAKGWYCHIHPAHPSFIRSFDKSPAWAMRHRGGAANRSINRTGKLSRRSGVQTEGVRTSATFRYCGPALARTDAERLLVPHLLKK